MIKLIVFDLWDTLAYKYTKVGGTGHLIRVMKPGIARKKFVKIFENSLQTKRWRSKYAAYRDLCREVGFPATRENVQMLIGLRNYSESKTQLFKHTLPMLKKLRKERYRIGLISNTSIFATSKLKKKTRLFDLIDYPLFSYDAGMIKPDPRIFRKMLKIAKVRPSEAIMIGDKMDDDVLAARKVGMNAIQFKNPQDLKKKFSSYGVKI